jgi:hypothetical protein
MREGGKRGESSGHGSGMSIGEWSSECMYPLLFHFLFSVFSFDVDIGWRLGSLLGITLVLYIHSPCALLPLAPSVD